MSERITKKMFYKKVEILESIMGINLDTSVWHNHFSVSIKESGYQLFSESTVKAAYWSTSAACSTLYQYQKINKGK
jgi:hypothetical protein